MTADGSNVYVFVNSSDHGVWYNLLSGSSWSGWKSLGGYSTSNPEVLLAGSDMYVFVRGSNYALWYNKLSGSSWSGWKSLGGYVTSDPDTLQNNVFVRGSDYALWYSELSGLSWSGWKSLGGYATAWPEAEASGSSIYLFTRGKDDAIWNRKLEGNIWSSWESLGGRATSNIDAISGNVFVRGTDNALWGNELNGSLWSNWKSLGGFANSEPVTAVSGNIKYLFAIGKDNAVWMRKLVGSNASSWESLGGYATSNPYAVTSGSDIYIFVRGTDYALWYNRLNGSSWSGWKSLGGYVISDPASASLAVPNGATVAYIGDPEISDFPNGISELTKDLDQVIPQSPTGAVDAVIFLGDLKGFSQARAAYQNSTVKNIPAFYVIGNHEAESGMDMTAIRDANMNSLIPLNPGPSGTEKTTYSFDIGNFHIVNLNEYWDGASNDAWFKYGTEGGYIPDALYNWTDSDLSGTSQRWKVVLGHEPLYPSGSHVGNSLDENTTNRDNLQNLFVSKNVSLFIGGHTHYAGVQFKDGVYHAVAGVTGTATLKGEDPFASIFYTYNNAANEMVLTWKYENPDWTSANTVTYTISR